jgi:hypothetical protein
MLTCAAEEMYIVYDEEFEKGGVYGRAEEDASHFCRAGCDAKTGALASLGA